MASEQELSKLVAEYLRARNFDAEAQKVLLAPTSDNMEEGASSRPRTLKEYARDLGLKLNDGEAKSSASQQFLFWALAGSSSGNKHVNIDEGYTRLVDWVFGSLDAYKPELMRITFPLFVHCYVELVSLSPSPALPGKFFERHSSLHSELHREELRSLSQVTTPAHLAQNEFVSRALGSKFEVEMSACSFELLRSFLDDTKLFFLLSMINRHVQVYISGMRPSTSASAASDPGAHRVGLLAETSQSASGGEPDVAASEVCWGVPSYLARPNADDADTRAPMPRPNPVNDSLKNARDRRSQGAEQRDAADTDACVELGVPPDAHEPSCVCYTMCNAHQGLQAMELSRDATHLAAAFNDSTIRVWRNDGQPMRNPSSSSNPSAGGADERTRAVLYGHHGPVYKATFSADQRHLLSCSADTTVRLWNLQSASSVECYQSHSFPVWDVSFSPVDYYFATASYDRTARLWSTEHSTPLRLFVGHTADVECVQFHPNCNYVLTGSLDRTARLWDVHTGDCVRVFAGHFGAVSTVAVSPDGTTIATAGTDRLINIWDLASGKKVKTLQGHTDAVHALDFSMGGEMLASGSDDCTTRLWQPLGDSATKPLRTLHTKQTPVLHVRFTQRNLLLVGGSRRG